MPLNKENHLEYWGNDEPKCPHCDRDIDIHKYDLLFLCANDNRQQIECPCCYEKFFVQTRFKWTFDTDEQE